jgi:Ser/Thr protein kinase RdoA (MazF antagonist)
VLPPGQRTPSADTTGETIARIEQLRSLIEGRSELGEDEASALRWLAGQRDWLRASMSDPPPDPAGCQAIHGDYHDANVVFRADAVAGVIDWERAGGGFVAEEIIRAMHLSFRLDSGRSRAFLDGYRSGGTVILAELDAAALSYGYRRDRSVWLMDELYRQGNERLRPLLNTGPFVPFEASWAELRAGL